MRKTGIKKPTDIAVLSAVLVFGNCSATYVVRNRLGTVDTPWVLRRLKAMEKQGFVERVPTSYRVMISWRVTDAGRAFVEAAAHAS